MKRASSFGSLFIILALTLRITKYQFHWTGTSDVGSLPLQLHFLVLKFQPPYLGIYKPI